MANKYAQYTTSDFDNFDCFDNVDDKLPLLMTEKDAVKCRAFAKDHWWYLPVDALISYEQIEQLKLKIRQII